MADSNPVKDLTNSNGKFKSCQALPWTSHTHMLGEDDFSILPDGEREIKNG